MGAANARAVGQSIHFLTAKSAKGSGLVACLRALGVFAVTLLFSQRDVVAPEVSTSD
jgi:hypothetical protein